MIVFLLLAQFSLGAVTAILNEKEIAVDPFPQGCPLGQMFAIYSQDNYQPELKEALGFGEIVGTAPKGKCRSTISSHSRSGLIRVKDPVELVNLRKKVKDFPARFDLTQDGKREISSRYKPLVYAGYVYGYMGATLDKGEWLVGPFPLAYGITNRLQVETTPIVFIASMVNLGLKYQFFSTEDSKISAHINGSKFWTIGKGFWWTELQWDNTSNARLKSHTKVRFTSKQPDSVILQSKDKEKKYTVEFSSVYQWILPGWDRLLIGPKFITGEETDLGLIVSAVFIYDSFHWTVGAAANSLANLNFRDNSLVASADLFWRF